MQQCEIVKYGMYNKNILVIYCNNIFKSKYCCRRKKTFELAIVKSFNATQSWV